MSEEIVSLPSSLTDVVEEISGQKSQSRKRKSVAQGAAINVKKKKGSFVTVGEGEQSVPTLSMEPLQDPTSSGGHSLVVGASKTPAALDAKLPPPLQDRTSSGGRPLVSMIQNSPPRHETSLLVSGGVYSSPYRTYASEWDRMEVMRANMEMRIFMEVQMALILKEFKKLNDVVTKQRDEFQTEVVRKQEFKKLNDVVTKQGDEFQTEVSQRYNAINLFLAEFVRKLDHLQQKQDQLASKQDLLYSKIAGECDTSQTPSVASFRSGKHHGQQYNLRQ